MINYFWKQMETFGNQNSANSANPIDYKILSFEILEFVTIMHHK